MTVFRVLLDRADSVHVDHIGAVHPDEASRVEGVGKARESLGFWELLPLALQDHVIILRLGHIELLDGDHMHSCALPHGDAGPVATFSADGGGKGGRVRPRRVADALARAPEGLGQPLRAEGLQDVVRGMHLESLHRILVVRGHEDDRDGRIEELRDFEAVELGHLDVQQSDIRRALRCQANGLEAIRGLPDDAVAGLPLEHLSKQHPRRLLIVHDQDAELASPGHLRHRGEPTPAPGSRSPRGGAHPLAWRRRRPLRRKRRPAFRGRS